MIWSTGDKLKIIVLFQNLLAQQTRAAEPLPKFQSPAPLSKSFGVLLQPSKIAWAPAPQPWWKQLCGPRRKKGEMGVAGHS